MSEIENQTKSRVLDRFQGHFGDISSGRDTTVARHFNGCTSDNPNKFSSIQISVLDFIKANPHSITAGKQRDKKEKHWIHQLHTAVPRGLNLMDSKTGHEIYRTPSCQDTGPKYFISQCFSYVILPSILMFIILLILSSHTWKHCMIHLLSCYVYIVFCQRHLTHLLSAPCLLACPVGFVSVWVSGHILCHFISEAWIPSGASSICCSSSVIWRQSHTGLGNWVEKYLLVQGHVCTFHRG